MSHDCPEIDESDDLSAVDAALAWTAAQAPGTKHDSVSHITGVIEVADALAIAGCELLDAEESHREAPTTENASRLARARRVMEAHVGQHEREPNTNER
jgi:hypothetical protein